MDLDINKINNIVNANKVDDVNSDDPSLETPAEENIIFETTETQNADTYNKSTDFVTPHPQPAATQFPQGPEPAVTPDVFQDDIVIPTPQATSAPDDYSNLQKNLMPVAVPEPVIVPEDEPYNTPDISGYIEVMSFPDIASIALPSSIISINKSIGGSEQGNIGDCWLLASLNSLSYTEKGRQILDDAISANEDGTYTIRFQGVDTAVTITNDELCDIKVRGQYSKGDDDVLLMEVATEKVMDLIKCNLIKAPSFLKETASNDTTSITGGHLNDIMYLLTGKSSTFAYNAETDDLDKNLTSIIWDLLDFLDPYEVTTDLNSVYSLIENNPNEYAATMSLRIETQTENGSEYGYHAFSIKSVVGDSVTIVNPWDSTKELTFKKEELKNCLSSINYFTLSGYDNKKECRRNFIYDKDGNTNDTIIEKDENGKIRKKTEIVLNKNGKVIKTMSAYDNNGNVLEIHERKINSKDNKSTFKLVVNNYYDNGFIRKSTTRFYDISGKLAYTDEKIYDDNGTELHHNSTGEESYLEEEP